MANRVYYELPVSRLGYPGSPRTLDSNVRDFDKETLSCLTGYWYWFRFVLFDSMFQGGEMLCWWRFFGFIVPWQVLLPCKKSPQVRLLGRAKYC